MLIIHNRDFQRSMNVEISALIPVVKGILKIVEATYRMNRSSTSTGTCMTPTTNTGMRRAILPGSLIATRTAR